MNSKRILIVDDEASILTVLKSSLKKIMPEYQVETTRDGFTALDKIQSQRFDLVVTDYNMAKMDGLELLEAIHYLHPSTPVIMITAYGSDAVQNEAHRLKAHRYLTKPLDINAFRQVVQETLKSRDAGKEDKESGFSEHHYRQINQLLNQLRQDISARCLFVTNIQGNLIARSGNIEKIPVEEIASLLGSSIATLDETGQLLDKDPEATNLVYRESKNGHLYAVNIGQQLLLILVIDRGRYSTRLGTVWYYTQQTADKLHKLLNKIDYSDNRQLFGDSLAQDFGTELDKLFGCISFDL